jgi:hypothetical protein
VTNDSTPETGREESASTAPPARKIDRGLKVQCWANGPRTVKFRYSDGGPDGQPLQVPAGVALAFDFYGAGGALLSLTITTAEADALADQLRDAAAAARAMPGEEVIHQVKVTPALDQVADEAIADVVRP